MPVEIQDFEVLPAPDHEPATAPAPAAPAPPADGADRWHRAHAVRRNRLRAD
ncbi:MULTISPECIES: hypothetical protein [unclassified Nocardioides]|uniref:hypothetical protein n=1 Tax=unclassified Nocardioides TaxID=2615069 RepID=UPI000ACD157F|nr:MULTISPECIES: hypothetical protein [unclassified Nocardioides]